MPIPIDISDWGKDHWSLLAYVECRCVDNGGKLKTDHLRINHHKHPHLIGAAQQRSQDMFGGPIWEEKYGTRLKGSMPEAPRIVLDHDDWDCLEDLQDADLVEIISETNRTVCLTEDGVAMAHRLRAWKVSGGGFAGFTIDTQKQKG